MLVDFEKLTDKEQEEFVKGFNDADDLGVNDWDSSTPWGAPWFWSSPENLDGNCAYEWGAAWFIKSRDEIEELLEEERENKSEED